MIEWLIRRFVKDSQNIYHPDVRAAYGTLGSGVGIAVNVLLALGKLLLGLFSGSVGIVADAVNNFSDAVGSVIALVTLHIAGKPGDREHPFGHGRMEYLGALAVSILIIWMGLGLLREGIGAAIDPVALAVSPLVFLLLIGSLLVKLWLWAFYSRLGQAIESATLAAAAKDSLSDMLATSAVLLGFALQLLFGWHVDGYIGVLVALVVLKTGLSVCREAVGSLLGERANPQRVQRLESLLLRCEGIQGVHDIQLHDYGAGQCVAVAHAEVSAQASLVDAHEWVDRAEREIGRAMNLTLVLHVDPIVTDDVRTIHLKQQVEAFLKDRDARLTLHDFRIAKVSGQWMIVFDCTLPGREVDASELRRALEEYVAQMEGHYGVLVHFDTGYE